MMLIKPSGTGCKKLAPQKIQNDMKTGSKEKMQKNQELEKSKKKSKQISELSLKKVYPFIFLVLPSTRKLKKVSKAKSAEVIETEEWPQSEKKSFLGMTKKVFLLFLWNAIQIKNGNWTKMSERD